MELGGCWVAEDFLLMRISWLRGMLRMSGWGGHTIREDFQVFYIQIGRWGDSSLQPDPKFRVKQLISR